MLILSKPIANFTPIMYNLNKGKFTILVYILSEIDWFHQTTYFKKCDMIFPFILYHGQERDDPNKNISI